MFGLLLAIVLIAAIWVWPHIKRAYREGRRARAEAALQQHIHLNRFNRLKSGRCPECGAPLVDNL